ncbi:MAG: acetylglutamate kinase [Planctomycetota bacterium]|nr:MAG: acetylglutamate kinase [Planctomycetota bacterium]
MSGPIVVKVGGSVLDEIAHMPGLWQALAEVHELRPCGQGLIVVHGGGRAIDAQLRALGMKPIKRDGVRVTPPEQIDTVVGVLAGVINTRMVAELRQAHAPAVGVTLADAGTVTVVREHRLGTGMGLVGRVVGGEASLFQELLDAARLPVVASIGTQGDGQLLNVNADEAAVGIAECVGAEMLVMLTDVPGVFDADGALIGCVDAESVEELIASGVVAGGMIAKLRSAVEAAEHLGCPVLIGSVMQAKSLLSGVIGSGTRVEPVRVRAMRAQG